ncbi:hypothetical protein JYP51_09560 [Ponticoccus gilvus]|nr:hypothetical protein [Enemella evansiae]
MVKAGKSGRRPADAGTPGRQEIWTAMRGLGRPFTTTDLVEATGAARKTVHDYLGCLAAAKYVTHEPAAVRGQAATYSLIRDTGHHAPRLRADGSEVTQGVATDQMWRSMRILKKFSFRDLTETATVDITEGAARAYCKMLLSTGYLRVLKKADPVKGRIAQYALIRDSGPRPPKVQRVKQVFDPNTGAVYMPGSQA